MIFIEKQKFSENRSFCVCARKPYQVWAECMFCYKKMLKNKNPKKKHWAKHIQTIDTGIWLGNCFPEIFENYYHHMHLRTTRFLYPNQWLADFTRLSLKFKNFQKILVFVCVLANLTRCGQNACFVIKEC